MSSILPSDLISPFFTSTKTATTESDAIDWTWKETPNSHIFKFELPGYSKSDITININTSTRVIHIATKSDKKDIDADVDEESKNVTWHCRERVGSNGRFWKEFRLPKNARIDGIEASMKDGVLIVTVLKECVDENGKSVEEEEGKKKRSVEIEGKGEDRRRGGVLGNCFVCFKS